VESGSLGAFQPASAGLPDRLQPFAENIRRRYFASQLLHSPSRQFCSRRTTISSHVYHEIFLHFNWHTKDDSPILVPAVEELGAETLGWQRGYGVVSFGKRNLPWVLEYIAHQKEHHAGSKVVDRLERADVDD